MKPKESLNETQMLNKMTQTSHYDNAILIGFPWLFLCGCLEFSFESVLWPLKEICSRLQLCFLDKMRMTTAALLNHVCHLISMNCPALK